MKKWRQATRMMCVFTVYSNQIMTFNGRTFNAASQEYGVRIHTMEIDILLIQFNLQILKNIWFKALNLKVAASTFGHTALTVWLIMNWRR